ncbi:MBL fold metallo-hydrolase [Porticoccus sp. W117]|uniref:MBL fold metallo-hydrolase n=1 Tax=Porticoccus sp. W117 TaxID=3054777 RepID=UPI0025971197|nr:MBL fold metallo-hydrolase [Porticoccus sp. W117]MDM3871068.1 MBL fold metallo-hydrolase [Porticoccus sp. W117]
MNEVTRISSLIRRITAPNPGPMTATGTHCYLVGNKQVAVIDPGPAVDTHIQNILDTCGDRLKWVVVTHTHPDHSPAAQALIAATGAEPIGQVMVDDGHQDTSFQVERNIDDGEWLECGEFRLQAIYTPGHVSNHVCYLLPEEGTLFAGDHLFGGGSVVIIPPSGDMKDYLTSLRRLLALEITTIAPAHGGLIRQPYEEIKKLIEHRLKRERKVIVALNQCGESSLETLLPVVYDDVDSSLHKIASYSLWAHLLKLEKDGVALKTIDRHWAFGEEHWVLV